MHSCTPGKGTSFQKRNASSHVCSAVKAKSARQVSCQTYKAHIQACHKNLLLEPPVCDGVLQICCSKTLVAKPEHKEVVQQLCQEAAEFSANRMKERSSGIQEFSCMLDGWEDNVIHFWERYDSNVSLGRHNTTPEMEGFMNKVRAQAWCWVAQSCRSYVGQQQ